MSTYTLTFGDRCENHAGMKIEGKDVGEGMGFNYDDLMKVKLEFEKRGCECELVYLNELKTLLSQGGKVRVHLGFLEFLLET